MSGTSFSPVPLGDGLYKLGGDIFSTYRLFCVSSVKTDGNGRKYKIFSYADEDGGIVYTITVSWTEDSDGNKSEPHWKRNYPIIAGGSQ